MQFPIFLIFGNDKLSNSIISSLNLPDNVILIKDKSTNIKKISRLVFKRRISLYFLFKTFYCQIRNKSMPLKEKYISISNNYDLEKILEKKKPKYIILFRAGLIINKNIINLKIPLINIHCARLDGFGGLGSIYKALKKEVYDQCATAHIVTEKIDEGQIIAEMPFKLNPNISYCKNELIAFKTGGDLLQLLLNNDIKISLKDL